MLAPAIAWKRNSLPARRATSPVQLSSGPSTAHLTPARSSSRAIAREMLFARSSVAGAQPTQKRISTSSVSRGSAPPGPRPTPCARPRTRRTDCPHLDAPWNASWSVAGNSPFSWTRYRRRSTMLVHVADQDRALLLARAARRARPERLRVDHRPERGRTRASRRVIAAPGARSGPPRARTGDRAGRRRAASATAASRSAPRGSDRCNARTPCTCTGRGCSSATARRSGGRPGSPRARPGLRGPRSGPAARRLEIAKEDVGHHRDDVEVLRVRQDVQERQDQA